jgi:hypothetical protein
MVGMGSPVVGMGNPLLAEKTFLWYDDHIGIEKRPNINPAPVAATKDRPMSATADCKMIETATTHKVVTHGISQGLSPSPRTLAVVAQLRGGVIFCVAPQAGSCAVLARDRIQPVDKSPALLSGEGKFTVLLRVGCISAPGVKTSAETTLRNFRVLTEGDPGVSLPIGTFKALAGREFRGSHVHAGWDLPARTAFCRWHELDGGPTRGRSESLSLSLITPQELLQAALTFAKSTPVRICQSWTATLFKIGRVNAPSGLQHPIKRWTRCVTFAQRTQSTDPTTVLMSTSSGAGAWARLVSRPSSAFSSCHADRRGSVHRPDQPIRTGVNYDTENI